MTRKLRVALALLIIGLFGGLLWQVLRERGPVYQGKPLNSWLKGFNLDNEPGKPTFNEAVEAVRQAGTNAFPVLLRKLRARDSDLKHRLIRVARKQPFIKVRYVPADGQQWVARQGFMALGTVAQDAVPSLLKIYHEDIARAETNSNRGGYIMEILDQFKDQDQDAAVAPTGSGQEPRPKADEK